MNNEEYIQSITKWRQEMDANLRRENGWLALAGLYWLVKHLLGWDIVQNHWTVVKTILFLVNGVPWLIYLVLLARLLERTARPIGAGCTCWRRAVSVRS